jgi:hypothetical protein
MLELCVDPDRVAPSAAGKKSAVARRIRKREAIERAGQMVLAEVFESLPQARLG